MVKRSPNIIVAGEVFSDNLGDQLIFRGVQALLKDDYHLIPYYFSKPSVRGFALRKLSETRLQGVQNCSLYRALSWVRHYFFGLYKGLRDHAPDYVLIGGGQLVLSNANFPMALFSWALCCRVLRIPFGVVGVGAGQAYTWFERCLIGFALRAARFVYARDRASIEILRDRFGVQASFIPDVAYAYCGSGSDAVFDAGQVKRSKKSVWVGITDYRVYRRYASENDGRFDSHHAYLRYWCDLVDDYVRQGYDVTLAWTTEADYHETRCLKDVLPSDDRVVLMGRDVDVDGFINALRGVDEVCAGRMHFLIMAHCAGCRVKPYFVSDKIKRYWDEYEAKSLRCIDAELNDAKGEIVSFIQKDLQGMCI